MARPNSKWKRGSSPIVTPRRQLERHRAMFYFDVGGVLLAYELEAVVKNMNVLV